MDPFDRISTLPRLTAPAAGKPERAGAAEQRRFARRLALDPTAWTGAAAREMAERFDDLAGGWDAERGFYRQQPLADALSRGAAGEGWPAGTCVEVGSGTGLLTPLLATLWRPVVCVDLSLEMLRRARHGMRVRADAARLPVPSSAAAAVVVADALLFAAEVVRVLRPDGVLVCSYALGADAPFHVSTAALVEALGTASGGGLWTAVESEAGWGSWAVLRRADQGA